MSKPYQRDRDVLIHVVHAHHETAMLIQQHAVAAQEKAHRQRQQKHGAQSTEESGIEAAGQPELAEVDLLDVSPVRHAGAKLPERGRHPIDQRRDDNQAES